MHLYSFTWKVNNQTFSGVAVQESWYTARTKIAEYIMDKNNGFSFEEGMENHDGGGFVDQKSVKGLRVEFIHELPGEGIKAMVREIYEGY